MHIGYSVALSHTRDAAGLYAGSTLGEGTELTTPSSVESTGIRCLGIVHGFTANDIAGREPVALP